MVDGPNQKAFLKMYHVIKHLLETKNLGLKIELNENEKKLCKIICFSFSHYGTRKSVSVFYPVCIRHTNLFVIKDTEKHDSVELRSQMCGTSSVCKGVDVHDPVTAKHENCG